MQEKECPHCKIIKPCNLENFYKQLGTKDGMMSWCKECIKTANRDRRTRNREICNKKDSDFYYANREKKLLEFKEYRETHRDYFKEATKKWRQSEQGKEVLKKLNNKRMFKNHKIKRSEWISCKEYFDNSCAYCGMTYEKHKAIHNQDLHKEHKDHDGDNDLSNCIPSCRICNILKRDKPFDEFYNSGNPNYTEERYKKITDWIERDYNKYVINKIK